MKLESLLSRGAISAGLRAARICIAGFISVLAVIARIALALSGDVEGFRARFEELTIGALGAGCCAFAVWLFVHLFNRGGKTRVWATRLLVGSVGALTLYVLSFGPACWLTSRAGITSSRLLSGVYRPIVSIMWEPGTPAILRRLVDSYARLAAADGWQWMRIDYFGSNPPGTVYTWLYFKSQRAPSQKALVAW